MGNTGMLAGASIRPLGELCVALHSKSTLYSVVYFFFRKAAPPIVYACIYFKNRDDDALEL